MPSFRSPFCPRWRRQVGQAQAGTGPDGFISGPHFSFLVVYRPWLIALVPSILDGPDRIIFFFMVLFLTVTAVFTCMLHLPPVDVLGTY